MGWVNPSRALRLKSEYMKMFYTRVVTKAVLNTQRKSTSAIVRTWKITWFNQTFTQTVKTNIAKSLFRLLDKHFPKSHLLYKIFNRNTVKVSYSCMNNVSQIIKQHNRNVYNKKEKQINPYNCRNIRECHIHGNGKVQNVIYKCTVSATQTDKRVYLGRAEGSWKQRLYNHRQSFKDKKHKNDTALSSYLWDLKENHNQIPKLTWSIVRFAPSYSNISKRCLLCLHEKLLTLNYHNPIELLNIRSELMAKCRHVNKFLLSNCKGNVINNRFVRTIAKFLYKGVLLC